MRLGIGTSLLVAGLVLCVAARPEKERTPEVHVSALAEFAYRELSVRLTDAEGKPVGGASIYGFCRELNLIWPRRDEDVSERNSVIWQESFLDKTGADGRAKVIVPPGKWG